MASSISAPPAPAAAIDYPSSDGKPMAESESQLIPLTYAVSCLRHYFRNRPEAFASGNLLIYYEEGTRARVAPDVFVVFGARNRKEERASYLLWKEAKAPDFVLEITSPGTWRDDQTWKRELYRRLGVREYWQYDPTRNYLRPPLQGLELVGGEYEPLAGWEMADGKLAARSEVLGLELRVAGRRLRFHDPQTGEDLRDLAEAEDGRQKAEEQRREAESRAEREAVAHRREAVAHRREAAAPPGSGRPPSRRDPRSTGGRRPPPGSGRPPGRRDPRPTGGRRPPTGGGRPPGCRNPRPTGGGRPPPGNRRPPPGGGRPPSRRSASGRTRGLATPQIRLTPPASWKCAPPPALCAPRPRPGAARPRRPAAPAERAFR